jgi:hypothetical protein
VGCELSSACTERRARRCILREVGPADLIEEYAQRFHREMQSVGFWIKSFAERVHTGGSLTLLCSAACEDEARCHRSLVKALIEAAAQQLAAPSAVRRARK